MNRYLLKYNELYESREELKNQDALNFIHKVRVENPELVSKFSSIIVNRGLEEAKKKYAQYDPEEIKKKNKQNKLISKSVVKQEYKDKIDAELNEYLLKFNSDITVCKEILRERKLYNAINLELIKRPVSTTSSRYNLFKEIAKDIKFIDYFSHKVPNAKTTTAEKQHLIDFYKSKTVFFSLIYSIKLFNDDGYSKMAFSEDDFDIKPHRNSGTIDIDVYYSSKNGIVYSISTDYPENTMIIHHFFDEAKNMNITPEERVFISQTYKIINNKYKKDDPLRFKAKIPALLDMLLDIAKNLSLTGSIFQGYLEEGIKRNPSLISRLQNLLTDETKKKFEYLGNKFGFFDESVKENYDVDNLIESREELKSQEAKDFLLKVKTERPFMLAKMVSLVINKGLDITISKYDPNDPAFADQLADFKKDKTHVNLLSKKKEKYSANTLKLEEDIEKLLQKYKIQIDLINKVATEKALYVYLNKIMDGTFKGKENDKFKEYIVQVGLEEASNGFINYNVNTIKEKENLRNKLIAFENNYKRNVGYTVYIIDFKPKIKFHYSIELRIAYVMPSKFKCIFKLWKNSDVFNYTPTEKLFLAELDRKVTSEFNSLLPEPIKIDNIVKKVIDILDEVSIKGPKFQSYLEEEIKKNPSLISKLQNLLTDETKKKFEHLGNKYGFFDESVKEEDDYITLYDKKSIDEAIHRFKTKHPKWKISFEHESNTFKHVYGKFIVETDDISIDGKDGVYHYVISMCFNDKLVRNIEDRILVHCEVYKDGKTHNYILNDSSEEFLEFADNMIDWLTPYELLKISEGFGVNPKYGNKIKKTSINPNSMYGHTYFTEPKTREEKGQEFIFDPDTYSNFLKTRDIRSWEKFWNYAISKSPDLYDKMKEFKATTSSMDMKWKHLGTKFGFFNENLNEKLQIYTDKDIEFIKKELTKKYKHRLIDVENEDYVIVITFDKDRQGEILYRIHLDIHINGEISVTLYQLEFIRHDSDEEIELNYDDDTQWYDENLFYLDVLAENSGEVLMKTKLFTPEQIVKIPESIVSFETYLDEKKSKENLVKFLKNDSSWANYWIKIIEKNPRIYQKIYDMGIRNFILDNKYKHLGAKYGFFESKKEENIVTIYTEKDYEELKSLIKKNHNGVIGNQNNNDLHNQGNQFAIEVNLEKLENGNTVDLEIFVTSEVSLNSGSRTRNLILKVSEYTSNYVAIKNFLTITIRNWKHWMTPKQLSMLPNFIHKTESQYDISWKEFVSNIKFDNEWRKYWIERIKNYPQIYVLMKKDGVKDTILDKESAYLGTKFGFFDEGVSESKEDKTISLKFTAKDLNIIKREIKKDEFKILDAKLKLDDTEIYVEYIHYDYRIEDNEPFYIKGILEIHTDNSVKLTIKEINDVNAEVDTNHSFLYKSFEYFLTPEMFGKIPGCVELNDNSGTNIDILDDDTRDNMKEFIIYDKNWVEYWSNQIEKFPLIYQKIYNAGIKNKELDIKFNHLGAKFGFFDESVLESKEESVSVYDPKYIDEVVSGLTRLYMYKVTSDNDPTGNEDCYSINFTTVSEFNSEDTKFEISLLFYDNGDIGFFIYNEKHNSTFIDVVLRSIVGWPTPDQIIDFFKERNFKKILKDADELHSKHDNTWYEYWVKRIEQNPSVYQKMYDADFKDVRLENKFKHLGVKYGFFESVTPALKDPILKYTARDARIIKFLLQKKYKNSKCQCIDIEHHNKTWIDTYSELLIKNGITYACEMQIASTIGMDNTTHNILSIGVRGYNYNATFNKPQNVSYILLDDSTTTQWMTPYQIAQIVDLIEIKINDENIKKIDFDYPKFEKLLNQRDSNWIKYWEKRIEDDPRLYQCMYNDGIDIDEFKEKYRHLGAKFGFFDENLQLLEENKDKLQLYDINDTNEVVEHLRKNKYTAFVKTEHVFPNDTSDIYVKIGAHNETQSIFLVITLRSVTVTVNDFKKDVVSIYINSVIVNGNNPNMNPETSFIDSIKAEFLLTPKQIALIPKVVKLKKNGNYIESIKGIDRTLLTVMVEKDKDWKEYWSKRIEKDPRIYKMMQDGKFTTPDMDKKFQYLGTKFGFFDD